MSTAAAQRQAKRRKKHQLFKRCLWCPKRAKKKSSLCRGCALLHRNAQRARWAEKRDPGAKQYRCVECGALGHNARRHKNA